MEEFYRQLIVDGIKEHNGRVAQILNEGSWWCSDKCTNVFLDHLAELGAIVIEEAGGYRIYKRKESK